MKKRIRIIHYSTPPVIGGVERIINGQARQFVENGYPVRVITGDDNIFFFDLEADPRDTAQKILEIYKDLPCTRMYKKAVGNFSWPMIFKKKIEPLIDER